MAGKDNIDQRHKQVVTLIEGVKRDNLTQFGEIKKDFGGVDGRLNDHNARIKELEKDKIERDAIKEYQRDHPEAKKAIAEREYNEGGVIINKELLTALKYLGLVIAALATAIIGMKITP